MSPTASAHGPERAAWRWVGAFNDRDLDAMLACLAVNVEFQPLELHGVDGPYNGHDGVRRWFAQLEQLQHHHRLAVSRISSTSHDRVLAVGALSLDGLPDGSPFCGLHTMADGPIVAAHHYLSEPNLLDQVGRPHEHAGQRVPSPCTDRTRC